MQVSRGRDEKIATLIGDVVLSREEPDQAGLLQRMKGVLARANQLIPTVQPLTMTFGDEFQGAYSDLGLALEATLLLRLLLGQRPELRFGLGWGEISTMDPEQALLGQSGPAWWGARAAIERVKDLEGRHRWPRAMRTGSERRKRSLLPSTPF